MFSKRYGTPIAVNALSGIISSLFMILAFQLTSGSTQQYFSAALGLAISTTTISYLAIFPALYLLRRKLPDVHRPYRVPFGNAGAFVISALTFGWALLATAALLWPGLGQSDPDSQLPSGFAAVTFGAGQHGPAPELRAEPVHPARCSSSCSASRSTCSVRRRGARGRRPARQPQPAGEQS